MVEKNVPERASKRKKCGVKTSPPKEDQTDNTVSKPEEKYCQCEDYIPEHLSVECESCELFWHLSCVGLTGLNEEMLKLLINWKCPYCFVVPNTSTDTDENRAIRAILKEEIKLFTPALTNSLKIALKETAEKTVDKAVRLYSDVTAKSQKKVLDDMSREQASETVISKVQMKMHTDTFERNKRKLNLCVLKVPESKKSNSKQRQEDDTKFCKETLKIKDDDMISCHRSGKLNPDKPDHRRPLIIQTRDEESVNFYSDYGKGWKESTYWINMDLCKADRDIRFLARKERKKRQEVAKKKETEKTEKEAKERETKKTKEEAEIIETEKTEDGAEATEPCP